MIHPMIGDREPAVLDIDEQGHASLERERQRGLADAVRADNGNTRAMRLSEAHLRREDLKSGHDLARREGEAPRLGRGACADQFSAKLETVPAIASGYLTGSTKISAS